MSVFIIEPADDNGFEIRLSGSESKSPLAVLKAGGQWSWSGSGSQCANFKVSADGHRIRVIGSVKVGIPILAGYDVTLGRCRLDEAFLEPR